MFKRLIILCFCLWVFGLTALPKLPPDQFLIVQFSRPVQKPSLSEMAGYAFPLAEALNTSNTLYKIGYNSSLIDEGRVTSLLRRIPYYVASQADGPVHFRATTPNDSLFSKQFHLGLIKATEAWDLTRSGVNRRGDTIVLAIIDDGLHVNHPDFQGNIWVNYADTAGNGLDDDSNGYIDDHYGWNFMNNNNDISDSIGPFSYKANHGTPVAGIAGAVGNNKEGISGIMWRVKLMIVNIADTGDFPAAFQSDALRAYSYVLEQRKLYNASGGKKGAFVVATNSSWGANGKFPHQAPLWCAMYDSLGKYGILNAIATSNTDGLVDTQGDLPTLCPSNHMIAVNASTADDKFFASGWSTTQVDLCAPGHNIFSAMAYTPGNIRDGRIYTGGHSGTSFASPMVTAAIGVLHSYACERVLDTIKMNPAKGNALMRKFILEGVDILETFNGKNVTSGRLNIKKSLQVMDKYCLGEVSVNAMHGGKRIGLFPNPGNGRIQVVSLDEVTSVACYDITGKPVEAVYDGQEIHLANVSDGMYVIRIMQDKVVHTFTYVKNSD